MPYDLNYKWILINKTNEQNRTRDLEIKEQTDSDQRGGEREITGETRGRDESKKMNRGLMDMDNGVGIHCGSRGQGRAGRAMWGEGQL